MDTTAPARPLFVTDHAELLDDLLRLAAAAGVEATVAHHPAHAAAEWARAPAVVVGADLLQAACDLGLRPRPHVVVAVLGGADTAVWEAALRLGAESVLRLPDDESRLSGVLADSAHARPGRGRVVSVVGGRGGAGASVLAVALALAGRRADLDSALVDTDPLGCGLDLLLGAEHADGARWGDLVGREGRLNWTALRAALPRVHGITLVTWERGPADPVPSAAVRAVVSCAARGADLVVADLPRGLGPAAEDVLRRTTLALLVVTADLPGVIAANRLLPRLRATAANARVVIGSGAADLSASDVTDALSLPLAGRVPPDRELARTLRLGLPPAQHRSSPLAAFADRVVADLLRTTPAAASAPGPFATEAP
ncbi:septum site-determining protein Ssd [Streptomonospora nanhaiensis]|uniref:Secretion/DNA translocation related CpaE-like protein n=1 Tax=Streptomonospora nanhaiensis TaxID=1323731 RepID=A0A853BQ96_9ACTN|nr:septum site-determining protein Ssd [Streptomonospora nanhaiensis]MBV2366787.1 histidine kinase [Streptomonospora nanhaiensis]MBX9387689.1 histidine kinase [Streptomonospora nanhaiensis]NYI96885.1 secretion/DNA translocation related CpaE-like protein [Streptomonospora nanhaiensis]